MILALLGAGFVAACGGVSQPQAAAPAVVAGVPFETVGLQSAPEFTDAVGSVQSAVTSVLRAQIGGTVRAVRVRPGDRVRRGELLALIDDRTPRAQLQTAEAGVREAAAGLAEIGHALEAAQANRAFAEATYKRYQGLLAKNSVSQQEFDNALTCYKAARANEQALEAKKQQVAAQAAQAQSQQASAATMASYARIVSPLDGVVVAAPVDPGSVVMPGTALLTVEDTSRRRLEVHVPENLASSLQLGQALGVSLPEGDFTGRIEEIVPAADPASRTFVVKIALPAGCRCRSGEFGKARIPAGDARSLFVPQAAVLERGELEGVFVADANHVVHFRLVRTGRTAGDRVEILSGLNPGERVAVSGVAQLRDGDRVVAQ